MTDFLEQKKQEIQARMDELRPAVEEYERLDAALRALSGVNTSGSRTTSRRSGGSAGGTGRRGRPPGSGSRAAQALEVVKSRPGITIPEMAQEMGIQQNYLYRVLPGLEQDGKVRKEGRGWYPV
jgi:predicted Rossmann fold nucleotide-binding protein DprA/Smf involved in DNA uptake